MVKLIYKVVLMNGFFIKEVSKDIFKQYYTCRDEFKEILYSINALL